jgi:hypothetical protein
MFPEYIIEGRKIHTLRADPENRWRTGMGIQHWKGSPRNPKSNPFKFADGLCHGVEQVQIFRDKEGDNPNGFTIWVRPPKSEASPWLQHYTRLSDQEAAELAYNDGLETCEFREFFVPQHSPLWEGKIIHFTEKRYAK